MNGKLTRLKALMRLKKVTRADIENLIHKSSSYVGDRMIGKRYFTIHEIYLILDYLEIPIKGQVVLTLFPYEESI